MSTSRVIGRAVLALLSAGVVVVGAAGSAAPVSAATDQLRVTFGEFPGGTTLPAGAVVADVSGHNNNGIVDSAFGGAVITVGTQTGVAADFPGKCWTEPCPNAMIRVAEHPSLDPLTADFEWGARIKLQSTETADGENVLQKGIWGEAGGQWKLQVDKAGGLPSCVVSGRVPGQTTDRRVILTSSVGVADGVWHQVTCRRTAALGIQILVDGVVRGRTAMPVVNLDSAADVTIGSNTVENTGNDQYQGLLDDVFMTALTPIPNAAPTAGFTATCVDFACTFDGSVSTDNGPLSYAWDFGDDATDVVMQPSHTFAALGDHLVTLTVTDLGGLVSTITQTVTLTENTPPTAAFTSACIDLSCTLDGSGSLDNGPLTYAWMFDDGATDVGVQPVHTFDAVGDHEVTLTVTDAGGLTASDTHNITIAPNSAPVAAFTSSCTNLVCAFDASTSTDGGPLTYAWTFGDGAQSTGIIASHTYAAAGSFPVTLTVTDAFGAPASVEHTVSVTRPISFVGRSTVSAISTNHVASVPTSVRPGDALLLFFSVGTNATVKQPTGIAGWVPVDTLSGSTASTRVWRKVATTADAGGQVRINISASSRANMTIVAYRGTSTTNPVATFARSLITTNGTSRVTPKATVSTPTVVVSYWMHRDSTSTSLTPPAGVTVRATGTQTGGGRVTVLTADSGSNVPVGQYGGLTARAAAASNMATAWTIVLAPA